MTNQNLATETVVQPAIARDETLEEEIFSINAIAPELLEHLPGLFEEAVRGSLTSMLGNTESKSVLASLSHVGLGNRLEVFRSLNSAYGHRASPLQKAVDRSFQALVHGLAMQVR